MKKLLLILMVGVLVVGSYLYGQATSIAEPITRVVKKTIEVMASPPVKIEVSPVVLIQAMEDKFESITFSMYLVPDEVKAGQCDGNWFQDTLYRDCLKMRVPGYVNAGFNRGILDRNRFVVTADTITIDLGTPVIYKPNIDHKHVKVLNPDDDGGWATDPDKNLQAKAFVVAEGKLRQAACKANILQASALSAEIRYGNEIREVLKAVGAAHRVVVKYTIPTDCA